MTLIVDPRISSVSIYIANAAKLYNSVSVLLLLSYSIALYISWCFRAYTMASYVLPISSRLWRAWIFRPSCWAEGSNERSICSISVSRRTKFLATDRPVRRNLTRKSSCSIVELLLDLMNYLRIKGSVSCRISILFLYVTRIRSRPCFNSLIFI